VNSTGLVLDRLGRAFDRDFDVPLASLRREDGPVAGVTAGAVLLRADMLREVGLLDPAYFAYCEDVDLSLRAARAGWRSWYVARALAFHGYEQSFGPESPRKKYLLARNHLRVVATHFPLPLAVALPPVLAAVRAVLKAPAELAAGRRAHARAHVAGAWDGLAAAARALVRRARGDVMPPGAAPR
jgi:GT2 family glycosyltransferase